jgi:hypothetical protein
MPPEGRITAAEEPRGTCQGRRQPVARAMCSDARTLPFQSKLPMARSTWWHVTEGGEAEKEVIGLDTPVRRERQFGAAAGCNCRAATRVPIPLADQCETIHTRVMPIAKPPMIPITKPRTLAQSTDVLRRLERPEKVVQPHSSPRTARPRTEHPLWTYSIINLTNSVPGPEDLAAFTGGCFFEFLFEHLVH